MENMLTLQGGDNVGDSAFFTRSNKSFSKQPHNKKHNGEQSRDYINNLKTRTRCYKCGEFDQWTAECPHPRQDKTKFSNKNHRSDRRPRESHNKQSDACTVTTEHINSGSSNPHFDSEPDSYAFMTVSRQSYALSVNMDKQT